MRKLVLWVLVAMMEVCLLAAPSLSYAAPSVGTGVTSTTAIINKIINSTPGINTVTTTGTGVTVRAAGQTAVAARGLSLPVGAVAEATVTAGRLAGLAAKAVRYGGWVGVASMVLPWMYEQSGYKTCPPPDFFCKKGPPVPVDTDTAGWWWYMDGNVKSAFSSTADGACQKYAAYKGISNVRYRGDMGDVCYQDGVGTRIGLHYSVQTSCPAGTTKVQQTSYVSYCQKDGPDVAATEADLGNSIEQAITNKPDRVGGLYDNLTGNNFPLWLPSDPVKLTPDPVVTAPPEVSVQTVPKSDGSVDTVRTETKTEVKPVASGSTLADAKIDYPVTQTTTTTTTNNVTGASTTTTNITNIYGTPATSTKDQENKPQPEPAKLPDSASSSSGKTPTTEIKLPDDYAREPTLKKILDSLTATVFDGEKPTGDEQLKAIEAKNKESTDVVAGITESSTGLKGWLPTIKTAECRNPKVPIPISGGELDVPICDSVDVFASFISAVIAVFALYGSVREVQKALKA